MASRTARGGRTQPEVAIAAGVEVRTVRRYESGQAPDTWLPLLRILELFGGVIPEAHADD